MKSEAAVRTVGRWLNGTLSNYHHCEQIAKALHLDLKIVLKAAAYTVSNDVPGIDDPTSIVIALVREVNWNPDRPNVVSKPLQGYIVFDEGGGS